MMTSPASQGPMTELEPHAGRLGWSITLVSVLVGAALMCAAPVLVGHASRDEAPAEPFAGGPAERTKVLTVTALAAVALEYSATWDHVFARCVNITTAVPVYVLESSTQTATAGLGPYCDTCVAGATLPPLGAAFLRTSSGTASVSCGFSDGWGASAVPPSSGGGGIGLGLADARYLKLDSSNDPVILCSGCGFEITNPSPSATAPFSIRTAASTGGNARFASIGIAGTEYFGFYDSTSTIGLAFLGPRIVADHAGTGTAALPSFSWEASPTMGLYRAAANELGFATSGVQRAEFWDLGLLLVPGGTTTNPTIALLSDQNTGVRWPAADSLAIVAGGGDRLTVSSTAITAAVGANFGGHVTPTSTNTVDLGSSSLSWRTLYLQQNIIPASGTLVVSGNVSNSGEANGLVTTDLVKASANNAAGEAMRATSGNTATTDSAVVAIGFQDAFGTVGSETPWVSYRTNMGVGGSGSGTEYGAVRVTAEGARYWGAYHTGLALDLGDTAINVHRGTAPAALPTCATSLAGQVRYKEDTDTAGTNSQLCLCARNNGALTYAWIAIGGSLTGTCT